MGYNVLDLLDKAINIAIRRKTIYENIAKEKSHVPAINIMAKILVTKADKTIKYYEALKSEIGDVELEEIDIGIYDKMSFLINEFNKKMYVPDVKNVKEFLKFSRDMLKDTYALLLDLRGRFIKNTSDMHTRTYKILSDIISNMEEHISKLDKTIKHDL